MASSLGGWCGQAPGSAAAPGGLCGGPGVSVGDPGVSVGQPGVSGGRAGVRQGRGRHSPRSPFPCQGEAAEGLGEAWQPWPPPFYFVLTLPKCGFF